MYVSKKGLTHSLGLSSHSVNVDESEEYFVLLHLLSTLH